MDLQINKHLSEHKTSGRWKFDKTSLFMLWFHKPTKNLAYVLWTEQIQAIIKHIISDNLKVEEKNRRVETNYSCPHSQFNSRCNTLKT